MTKRQHPEEDFQKAVAGFLEIAMPAWAPWSAFPAGGGGVVRGAILRGMGLKKGWPDVIGLYQGKFWGIECKAGTGLSAAQTAVHAQLRDHYGTVCVCRTLEEVEAFLKSIPIPLRAHIDGGKIYNADSMHLATGKTFYRPRMPKRPSARARRAGRAMWG